MEKTLEKTVSTKVFVFTLSLIVISSITLSFLKSSRSHLPIPSIPRISDKTCDVFKGKWVPYPQGPYYSNETCRLIVDQHNCMKFGRPDTEFMKWRWKPDECELPRFDAAQFLEVARGKSMAFVGDSVARNQMESLLCLLAHEAYPEDKSHNSKLWFYADYNFTLSALWSPFLVKSRAADINNNSSNGIFTLYLDQPDEEWSNKIEKFDYVIVSAGQWFFRPMLFYQNSRLIGCYNCNQNNITSISKYHAYRTAFRTAFETLISRNNYTGAIFLRTFSAAHYENGEWDKGGNCGRTRPFRSNESKLEDVNMEFYLIQVEELRKAKEKGKKRGLIFEVINSTEIMWLRPDGHPSHYGKFMKKNTTVNDCVHWCLPGPIDTLNQFLLYFINAV
ncbi:hypothetical protein F3Y22_tig00111644pilonHSYRG00091 [Hibiscus syriacus]|uniref:Uncharacterized protein n=1 Tax=Hibiscus syriacus TaxID=106335 RepID=A0A6A2Y4I6_HIBSY|nr:protein trichome birefringence-like 19 [Hibiscus syriacus]KAE8675765.1 hypothetical protein F3Y22_tig00111644pilonHSYRG00091 [Hibiscus syriacus]